MGKKCCACGKFIQGKPRQLVGDKENYPPGSLQHATGSGQLLVCQACRLNLVGARRDAKQQQQAGPLTRQARRELQPLAEPLQQPHARPAGEHVALLAEAGQVIGSSTVTLGRTRGATKGLPGPEGPAAPPVTPPLVPQGLPTGPSPAAHQDAGAAAVGGSGAAEHTALPSGAPTSVANAASWVNIKHLTHGELLARYLQTRAANHALAQARRRARARLVQDRARRREVSARLARLKELEEAQALLKAAGYESLLLNLARAARAGYFPLEGSIAWAVMNDLARNMSKAHLFISHATWRAATPAPASTPPHHPPTNPFTPSQVADHVQAPTHTTRTPQKKKRIHPASHPIPANAPLYTCPLGNVYSCAS